jgi:thiamine biosynthesis lipoprotein
MGTGWSLAFAAAEKVTNAAVVAALEDVFALVIRQMSGWERESDLCRFNRAEAGWRELPADFYQVLSRAIEIAEATGGAYDPTLGAQVDALGFGPGGDQTQASDSRRETPFCLPPFRGEDPDASAHMQTDAGGHIGIEGSMSSPPSAVLPPERGETEVGLAAPSEMRNMTSGWRDIRLEPAMRRAFQPGGVTLDLSSIAKGHAVDLCANALRALGIPSFLMEIGGEFVGEGVKPDGNPWWVELQLADQPPATGEPAHTDVALVNLALATSGDFVRRRDGVSHLFDGRTGEPLNGALSGVSVMHASAMEADGWATALFALGPEAGMLMADAQGLAVVFARRTEEGARFELSRAASEMLG